jgi:hypothetical protein
VLDAISVWTFSIAIHIHPFRLPSSSVSDPYSFFPDPDPEVEAGGQYGSGSRALMTKKLKKITAEKKKNF